MTPALWIGRRRVDCRRHPRPAAVWPVRIRAGAFGENVPAHDLLLSPDHCVFADGVMIPVGRLVNGSTLAQERCDEVTYYHLELVRHDVVLAEGLPVESYLDTGNRSSFENGRDPVRLHPDFAPPTRDALGCAPVAVTGPVVATVRRRLLQRAARARLTAFPCQTIPPRGAVPAARA